MRVFFLDLWMDLREKRLAPLAVLLLGAIVAVPIVLAKDEKAPPPPALTATTASAAPVIQTDASAATTDSKLQTFSARDPFEATSSSSTTTSSSSSSTSSSGSSSSESSGPTGSTGAGTASGGSTATPTDIPVPSVPGGGTNGSGPSSGTGTGTNGTGNTTGETKTTLFTYDVDLRFGQSGSIKAYKGVKRLDLVPDEKNPKIVFLGVTTTGKTAVFLVDSNMGVDSGGKCRPSPDECTFLYLRPDADHDQALLTDADGTVYHMRLVAIHRVSVSSSNGSTGGSGKSGGSNGTGNSNRSPAFTGQAKRKSSATVPGEDAPPGEPNKRSTFSQLFADAGK